MGQWEVMNILVRERKTGNDSFLSIKDVEKLLKEAGFKNNNYDIARRSLMRLCISGYLDVKMSGKYSEWYRTYRAKQKYILIEEKTK